jgi:hypothetical protein
MHRDNIDLVKLEADKADSVILEADKASDGPRSVHDFSVSNLL